MNQGTAALLGAIAGFTIFIGLPVARFRGMPRRLQGLLNMVATGILVFLLWDILSHASAPVESSLAGVHRGQWWPFAGLLLVFAAGLAIGFNALVYVNLSLQKRMKGATDTGTPSPRTLSLMIATGLGLHNLSEGLAIGQSAAAGAMAFAGVLVIGFSLHNITEGFGIAAPMSMSADRASWGFLLMTGLIGGGPTFVGSVVGYLATSTYLYVVFLALAAGALIYVVNELFALGKRLSTPQLTGVGILVGFLAAYGSDLLLTYLAV